MRMRWAKESGCSMGWLRYQRVWDKETVECFAAAIKPGCLINNSSFIIERGVGAPLRIIVMTPGSQSATPPPILQTTTFYCFQPVNHCADLCKQPSVAAFALIMHHTSFPLLLLKALQISVHRRPAPRKDLDYAFKPEVVLHFLCPSQRGTYHGKGEKLSSV